jgi:hypothetical protein
MAVSSTSAMHAGPSDQAYYLPILVPAPSLIPSPISTTGWTSVHAIDRPLLRSSRRPAPSTTGRCLVPGSRTISTRIVPSPPGQQHSKTATLPLRIDPRSRRAGGFPRDRQPLEECDTLIRPCYRIFITESEGPLHDLRGPRDHAGRPPPGPRRSPTSPPHDLPLRPSSRSLSR